MGKIRKSKAVGRVTHIKQPGEKEFWKYVKETKGYGTKGSPVSDDIIGKAYKDLKAGKFEYKKYVPPKAKTATKKIVFKAVAKKTIGKAIAKKLPYVGAAIIARDIIKGISKSTCSKRGGKWVSGKCVGTKKTKFKAGSKVRDPISKR